jgi:hypothetical protein
VIPEGPNLYLGVWAQAVEQLQHPSVYLHIQPKHHLGLAFAQ